MSDDRRVSGEAFHSDQGMGRQFTEDQIREHDRACEEGWSLVEGHLIMDGEPPSGKPGWFARRRLARALECFEKALKINPDGWQSVWAMGKIHQRLGDTRRALTYFARAHKMNPDQVDVAREAGIAAADVGDGPRAVQFTRAAVALAPDDAGLTSNLALALLINDQVQEAQATAADAVGRVPADPVAKTVKAIIDEVAAGTRRRPRSVKELH